MTKKKLGLVLIVIVLLAGFNSCDLFVSFFGTTIDERIDAFNDDVADANWNKLYTHFHSDTIDRDTMKNDPAGYWDSSPFWNGAEIVNFSVSGTTVTGIESFGDQGVTVEMKREGLDYMMYHLTVDGGFDIRKID